MTDSYLEFLEKEAAAKGIAPPTKRTLNKYGLNRRAWLVLMHEQEWKCPICLTPKALWNIDHQHVAGWNKMTLKEKVRYVRGILCWMCNKNNAPSNLTAVQASRLASYLGKYEHRRDGAHPEDLLG